MGWRLGLSPRKPGGQLTDLGGGGGPRLGGVMGFEGGGVGWGKGHDRRYPCLLLISVPLVA